MTFGRSSDKGMFKRSKKFRSGESREMESEAWTQVEQGSAALDKNYKPN
jgi:hypothetical protein